MRIAKLAAAMFGWLTSLHHHVPGPVMDAAWILLLFMAVDLVATVRANGVCHETSARTERERFLTKATQYSIVTAICWAGSYLSENIFLLRIGLVGLGGIEFIEMLRQLARLEDCGGVQIAPVRPFLRMVGKLFLEAPMASLPPEKKKKDKEE